jgi:hypothetical protein
MALPIRDGNQSLTTLSTILVSNSHIPAHTVISFGTQGITDIATAVSGVELGPNTLNALENITVTLGQVTITGGLTDTQLRASAVTIGGSVTATISGTASVTFGTAVITGSASILNFPATQTVTFTQASVTFGTAVITGSTSIIGTPSVTFTQIATHGVTIGSGTAQIGSVTASISGTPSVTFTQASVTFGTAVVTGSTSILNFPATQPVSIASVTIGNSVTISSLPAISGTVTANAIGRVIDGTGNFLQIPIIPYDQDITSASDQYAVPVQISSLNGSVGSSNPLPISGTVTIGSALPAGTNRIGVVTIGGGTVTIGAGTAQIGSVTASISGTVTIFPVQGTSVTTSNFTSTTPSQTIASASSGREILTIFNEGAGNLHVCAGSTCTTIGYQVRLSSGDYWECPTSQVQLIHTAVFATAGTARVTEIG